MHRRERQQLGVLISDNYLACWELDAKLTKIPWHADTGYVIIKKKGENCLGTRFKSLSMLLASLFFLAATPPSTGEVNPEQYAVTEDVSLRQANSKAYRINPSEIRFEIYPSYIHYMDGKGRFQDIDNTIIPVFETAASGLSGYRYRNRSNSAIVYFGDGNILIRDGDHSVSFVFQGNLPGIQPSVPSSMRPGFSEPQIAISGSSVLYADMYRDADAVCTVTEHGLKEDIILRSRGSDGIFEFRIISENLIPRAVGGCVVFEDAAGSPVSSLGELVMHDSAGHVSDDLSYSLDGSDGEWVLSVTASKEFLDAEDTVYPVTVDPSYSFQWKVGSGITYDTFTSEKYSGTNYGTSQTLALSGSSSYEYGITDLFIRFSDVEKIVPYDFPVSSAQLILNSSRKGVSTPLSLSLNVRGVEGSWNEGTLTKKNEFMVKWPTELGTDFALSGDLMVIDVSEVVQRWNHTGYKYAWGFQIENSKPGWIELYSCENPKKELGPRLAITAQDTSSYAMKSTGVKSDSRTVAYFDNMKNSSYTNDLSNATASWNRTNANSKTGIAVTRKTASDPNLFIACDSSSNMNSMYGINKITYEAKTGRVVSSNIYVNFSGLEMNTKLENQNAVFRQSVITHEIGHTFGLDDRESGIVLVYKEKWSIMDYGADHHIVVVPSRCDVLNVLDNYKNYK